MDQDGSIKTASLIYYRFAKAKKWYRVTYGSNGSNTFKEHKGDGEVHSFMESDRGLFYQDITEKLKNKEEYATDLVHKVANTASAVWSCRTVLTQK